MTIGEILDLTPQLRGIAYRAPTTEIISETSVYPQRNTLPAIYEDEVFQYLFANKATLGIKEVHRYQNQNVDGALLLIDGRLVPMEIKYRMNWPKACQAMWQLVRFCARNVGVHNDVIVFFKEHSGDWNSVRQQDNIKMGWVRWYLEYFDVSSMRFHLIRLCDGHMETYHDIQ